MYRLQLFPVKIFKNWKVHCKHQLKYCNKIVVLRKKSLYYRSFTVDMLAKMNMQGDIQVTDPVIIFKITFITSTFYFIMVDKCALTKLRFIVTDSQIHLKSYIHRWNYYSESIKLNTMKINYLESWKFINKKLEIKIWLNQNQKN